MSEDSKYPCGEIILSSSGKCVLPVLSPEEREKYLKEREQYRKETLAWVSGEWDPKDWTDSPKSAPEGHAVVNLRVSPKLLEILREFARREGIGIEALIKYWLTDRIIDEREILRSDRADAFGSTMQGITIMNEEEARLQKEKNEASRKDSLARRAKRLNKND